MCTVAAGSRGGRRLSLADYVRGTGATRGATAAGQCLCWPSSLQRLEAGQAPLWVVPELQGLLGYEVGFPQPDSRGGAHGHDAA